MASHKPSLESADSAPGPRSRTASDLSTPGKRPSEEEIARRAYEIFLEHGGRHGNDLEDWLQAERELKGLES